MSWASHQCCLHRRWWQGVTHWASLPTSATSIVPSRAYHTTRVSWETRVGRQGCVCERGGRNTVRESALSGTSWERYPLSPGLAHSCLSGGYSIAPDLHDSPHRLSQPRLPRHCQRCTIPWQTAEDPATDPDSGGEFGWGWTGQWGSCGGP